MGCVCVCVCVCVRTRARVRSLKRSSRSFTLILTEPSALYADAGHCNPQSDKIINPLVVVLKNLPLPKEKVACALACQRSVCSGSSHREAGQLDDTILLKS